MYVSIKYSGVCGWQVSIEIKSLILTNSADSKIFPDGLLFKRNDETKPCWAVRGDQAPRCHSSSLYYSNNFPPSQKVSAPEKEGLSCGRYTREETYSRCDMEEVASCLQECCGPNFTPLWTGAGLEKISSSSSSSSSSDLPSSARCKHFLLGEETTCLPPCTQTSVQVSSGWGSILNTHYSRLTTPKERRNYPPLCRLWFLNKYRYGPLMFMFMLQTMFMYKTVSRKSVRYHTLQLPNRWDKTGPGKEKRLKTSARIKIEQEKVVQPKASTMVSLIGGNLGLWLGLGALQILQTIQQHLRQKFCSRLPCTATDQL